MSSERANYFFQLSDLFQSDKLLLHVLEFYNLDFRFCLPARQLHDGPVDFNTQKWSHSRGQETAPAAEKSKQNRLKIDISKSRFCIANFFLIFEKLTLEESWQAASLRWSQNCYYNYPWKKITFKSFEWSPRASQAQKLITFKLLLLPP